MAIESIARPVLSDEIIERCGERAAEYERENRCFFEDFDELKQAG